MIYVVVKLAKAVATPPQRTGLRRGGAELVFDTAEHAAVLGQTNPTMGATAVALDNKDRVSCYYTDAGAAEAEAKRLAVENPTRQYAVLGMLRVFETTEPKIISKVINDSGELILEK